MDFSQMPTDKFEALVKSIQVPIWLERNTDFYVNGTTGADTLDAGRGMSKELPFKTIQAAVNYVSDNYNLSRFYATINITAGTYNEAVTVGQLNATTGGMIIKKQAEEAGEVQIKKVKTEAGSPSTFTKNGTGNIQLHELTIEMESNNDLPDASSSGDAFAVNVSGGVVRLYNCTCIYRATKGFQRSPAIFFASDTGQIHINTGNTMKSVFTAGDKPLWFLAKPGGSITLDNMDANTPDKNKCTISGAYNVVAYLDGGTFTRAGTTKPTLAADGSVTGKRYQVTSGGHCNTGGGGANYFPGDADGTVDDSTFSWYK